MILLDEQTFPVDDVVHEVPGRVVHVERSGLAELTVWFERDPAGWMWKYQKFETGQPIPDDAHYVRTVLAGQSVWHLYLVAVPFQTNQANA